MLATTPRPHVIHLWPRFLLLPPHSLSSSHMGSLLALEHMKCISASRSELAGFFFFFSEFHKSLSLTASGSGLFYHLLTEACPTVLLKIASTSSRPHASLSLLTSLHGTCHSHIRVVTSLFIACSTAQLPSMSASEGHGLCLFGSLMYVSPVLGS